MDILIQDVKFALRSLRRSPGFTAVVVAVMALGIGVNTMIFCMVYGVMIRPWPLPQFDRVLTVNEVNDDRFEVLIIPHTLEVTTFGALRAGDHVNLEVDLMARYAARLTEKA